MKTIIAFPVKALSIGIMAIMLAACGEETDHIPPALNQPGTNQPNKPPVTTLPGTTTPGKPPVTSIPATPLEPSTPIKPSVPLTPLEPSTPIKPSVPLTPLEPSTPIKPSVPLTPLEPSTPIKYPEPQKDIADYYLLGFFDYNGADETREIGSDLLGSFQAMIQFGQNHVVDPQGNEAKNMPRLTAEKEALLLVTPTLEMGAVNQLVAEIYKDGMLLRRVDLVDPTHIPRADQTNSDGRPRHVFRIVNGHGQRNYNGMRSLLV